MEWRGYRFCYHCSFILLLLLVVVVYVLGDVVPASLASGSAGDDACALMQFRSLVTEDPYGALASWGGRDGNLSASPAPPCGWRGVTCGVRGRRRGRVTALDLRRLGLAGVIATPSSLSGLTYLRRLELAENRLRGGVPSLLPPSLEHLNLSYNALQGAGAAGARLESNNLTGGIPASLGNLTSLTILALTSNNLGGLIPGELGNLCALTSLYLNMNMLEGSIPSSVFNLSSLRHLIVQFNNLTGTLHTSASDRLPRLKLLSVDSNQLRGAIPVFLCNSSQARSGPDDEEFLLRGHP
ncbi:hypothetical protein E2562_033463 [Oryza meyeriana var. granulata]|uniref:non-specific serine/threonine protein kinase n=1 Tax=Oryza meyeriana var. granulata TaxID=110450 RepID=A0A6G1E6Q5_9ORYZ|nr:hypothetical protein E2562_033463 [Oryza meyeriana var. granulata]